MSKFKVQSNYWKIDNVESDITHSISINTTFSKESDTIAVSSNYASENLKIFQLAANSLIHLASITLPDIHSLKFLKPVSEPPHNFKFLLSGHSNGIVHLSAIPLTENSVFENAEIIKRFNHKKHLKSSYPFERSSLTLNNGTISTSITSIDLSSSQWTSSPMNSMVSVYNHHLFYWDTARSKAPLSIIKSNGVSHVTTNKNLNSVIAISGDFGLSLIDLRTGKNQEKTSIFLPSSNSLSSKYSKLNGFVSSEWCENNENYIATIQASDDVVHLWDIRKMNPITKLTGFTDSVTQIKWKNNSLWTGDKDGYLTRWDTNNLHNLHDKECITSNNDSGINNIMLSKSKLPPKNKIELGSSVKISESKILSLDYDTNENSIICLDNSYLSSHSINGCPKRKIVKRISVNTDAALDDKLSSVSSSGRSNSSLKTDPPSPTSDTFSSNKTSIFSPDSSPLKSGRRGSADSVAVSISTDNISSDFLANYQKELDKMIKNMSAKKINETIYL